MADLPALDNDCMRYARAPIERAVVAIESAFNPFAIGVVNGRLARQPRTKEEAVATALSLKAKGYNYSMGCRQVNHANLVKYGLDHESVFDPLKNSLVGSAIYEECRTRAAAKFGDRNSVIRAALSCYYSGSFTRGQQKEGNSPSYAEKVLGNISGGAKPSLAIPVVAFKGTKPRDQSENKPAATGAAGQALAQQIDQQQRASWDVFKDF